MCVIIYILVSKKYVYKDKVNISTITAYLFKFKLIHYSWIQPD